MAEGVIRTPTALRWRPGPVILRFRAFLGRHLTVRWKLTIWYALVCGVTLALVGVGMLLALNYQVQNSIDQSIQETATAMGQDLHQRIGPFPSNPGCGRLAYLYCQQVQADLNAYSAQVSKPGQFEQVQFYDPSEQGALQNPLLTSPFAPTVAHQQGIQVDAVLLSRAANSRTAIFTDVSSHADRASGIEHFRVYVTRIQVPPGLENRGVVAILEVFQSRHDYLDIERSLVLILLTAVPVGVLLALASGWWIARVALRPVNRISLQVRRIGESRDLSRRLRFIGPSDEVSRLAATFDGMMDRLEKVFESQRRFIADASHELRTPLTAIRGNADLMAMAPPEGQKECLSAIRRESERMSRLVSDLLLLAEADIEEQPMHMVKVDLDALLADVCRSESIVAADKVSVRYEPCDQPLTVWGDPDRLKQLFLNLTDNAVKFTPRGGEIIIRLLRAGSEARVDVWDNGIGIAPDEQEAIFQRFYRVEASRSTRGSGLGLSICNWIARAHGGRVELKSTLGKGSTFSVCLPLQDHVHPIDPSSQRAD